MRKISCFLIGCVKTISRIAEILGAYSILRWTKRKKVVILAYHGINSKNIKSLENFDGKHVNKDLFEKQIIYLKKHYSIISLDYYLNAGQNNEKLPRNPAIITFDDGFRNNFTVLYPLIKKYNVPVTIFLSVRQAEKRDVPWQNIAVFCIANTKKMLLTLNMNGHEQIYNLASNKDRLGSLIRIRSDLLKADETKRKQIIKELIKKSKVNIKIKDDNFFLMSWPEIKKLKNISGNLVSFGSHALTHTMLTQLTAQQAKKELIQSKKIIEKKLGIQVKHFSYPFGAYNRSSADLCRFSGYSSAVTTDYGYNDKSADLFKLKRIAVSNNYSMDLFMLSLFVDLGNVVGKISKAYVPLKRLLC